MHGEWIDATQGVGGVKDDVRKMLSSSPADYAEEWAIHDYDGFGDISISEYQSFETIADYAEFIEAHGDLGAKLIAHFGDLEDAQSAISDNYVGSYESVTDYAEQVTQDTTEIPETLRFYIDYEKMGRDLEINDVLAIEVGFRETHIFWRF